MDVEEERSWMGSPGREASNDMGGYMPGRHVFAPVVNALKVGAGVSNPPHCVIGLSPGFEPADALSLRVRRCRVAGGLLGAAPGLLAAAAVQAAG
jgi:hypothetical protein